MDLPSGVVTVLSTDIESSMQLWTADATSMAASLERHDRLVSTEIDAAHGLLFSRAGSRS